MALNYWCDPDFLKFYWVKGKNFSLENERIANLVRRFPKIETGSLIKRLNHVMWLKPEYLRLWIKLESIWLCKLFAPIDINMIWDGLTESSWSKLYKKIDSHDELD